MTAPPEPLLPPFIVDAVERALKEDLGRAGDITSAATIPPDAKASAIIAARQDGIVAGLPLAEAAFRKLDPDVEFETLVGDGEPVRPGATLARITGKARAVLGGERVALNFLGHLSGIATLTRRYADAISHTRAKITCTRKTTPGLRALEKYAVRCGGGSNHRFGLDDAVLIKDNHIAVAGGVIPAIQAAKSYAGHLVKIEVEVDTLDQLQEALSAQPDVVMLDNMTAHQMREAVRIAEGKVLLEASGGIDAQTIVSVAETGVDLISSGWITHSAPILDLGLDIGIS